MSIPDYDLSMSNYSISNNHMNWSFEPEELGLLRAQIQALVHNIERNKREMDSGEIEEWRKRFKLHNIEIDLRRLEDLRQTYNRRAKYYERIGVT
jgi:hypothetical protein